MRSQRRNRQCPLSQRVSSSMRLPLQTSRPFAAQYRQIAFCTNRGKRREGRIELAGIDTGGEASENVSASAGAITAHAVGMLGPQPPEDPSSMQEIVHQRVDRHQAHADLAPQRPLLAGAQQQVRQRHRQHLVGNAVDVAQRTDDGLAQAASRFGDWEFTEPNCASIQATRSSSATSRMNRNRL